MPDADAMTLMLIFSVKADNERRETETVIGHTSQNTSQNTREISYKEFRIPQLE